MTGKPLAVLELPCLVVDDIVAVLAATRLLLVNRDPGPNEDGVPIDSAVALEAVDIGTDGIDRAVTRVWVDGVLAFEGGASPELRPGFDGPRAGVVQTADTLRIVLDPVVPFASKAIVEIRVESATVGGGELLSEAYTFTVEDRTAPRVLAAQATAPKTVQVAFDEPMAMTDPSGFTFMALDVPAVPPQARSSPAWL